MWNRSRVRIWTTLLPSLLYLAFFLFHLTSTVAGGSRYPYTPVDNILLNCGSTGNSTALDNRTWIGDVGSKFFPVEQSQNQASQTASAAQQFSSDDKVPYANARLSLSEFTYIFPVTDGQKFIRLYFYPASYPNFDRFNALFSVKVGRFTLLNNFNASLTADADDDPGNTIFREYCVNIEEDQRLNITFTPSVANAYAFINGIEILSMPPNLYYTPSNNEGFTFIGQLQRPYSIKTSTALEMVYRLNVGGRFISPAEDTGMFRRWIQDDNYFTAYELVLPFNETIELKFTTVRPYTAPDLVYKTARTMGTNNTLNKSYNLTWEFTVDSGFDYLVRLHFCEFQPEITKERDRTFLIFIANQTAEEAADVMVWSGGNGVPVYKEYAVSMIGKEGEKKMNLSIVLKANPQNWETSYNNAILNGVEIFKVSAYNGSLAGPNPDPHPAPPTIVPPTPPAKSKNSRTTIVAVVAGGVSGFVVLLILGFLIFRRSKRVKDSDFGDGTTKWGLFSFSTTKSTKTHRSSLPSALCRDFSLSEIRAATNNFDDVFIIGVGGFGDVYKGYIDGGVNPVAIKRLKPGSQQGAHEFETEIKMLSQLRHLHLVSLIGYCNDGDEMILVYDYMANGTLRDHLYNTHNPPLSWKQRLEICIGAARGLTYLHTGAKHTIIHRDVKTTNILLNEKWEAKVSDFGLSKMGPTSVSKAHVSTVVKGSFGYLDPEYFRRQQLTEKSDVYSFGVVLCEVLCARAPIMRIADKKQVSLAEWARQSHHNGKMDQMVDPTLTEKIAPECLKKYCEIAVNCLLDNGIERPSMNDVVWGLEFALQLQESDHKDVGLDEKKGDEKTLLPKSKIDDSSDNIDRFSSSGIQMSSINSNSSREQNSSSSSRDSSRLMSSGAVFSEIMNPLAR